MRESHTCPIQKVDHSTGKPYTHGRDRYLNMSLTVLNRTNVHLREDRDAQQRGMSRLQRIAIHCFENMASCTPLMLLCIRERLRSCTVRPNEFRPHGLPEVQDLYLDF